MTTPHSRDSAMDQWLQRATAAAQRDDGVSPECLDAETAAAWFDGRLAEASLRRAREHTADCARCQALMATLAEHDTAASPAPDTTDARVQPAWSNWLRWMVPLGAAATLVLVVSVWVRTPAPAGGPGNRAADQPFGASRVDAPVNVPSDPAAAPESTVTSAARDTLAPTAAGSAASRPESTAAQERRREAQRAPAEVSGRLSREAPAPAPAPAGAAAVARQEVAPLAAPAAAPAPPAQADAAGAPPPVVGRSASPQGVAAARNSADVAALKSEVAVAEFGLPGQPARWRVAGGRLEQRATSTAPWEEAVVPPGSGVVIAGAAVNARVAWAVGASGLVLRTTDGDTWSRVPFPQAVDLLRVDASSAESATVITVAGARLGTVDAGVTWR